MRFSLLDPQNVHACFEDRLKLCEFSGGAVDFFFNATSRNKNEDRSWSNFFFPSAFQMVRVSSTKAEQRHLL